MAASASPRRSSTLFATRTTGLCVRRSTLTTSSSASVAPTVASRTNMIDVGVAHRALGLGGDLGRHALRLALPAAGVEDEEPVTGPLGLVGDAVARHPGNVLDDGLAASEDAVDESGLADVRPPDDRDDRQQLVVLVVEGREVVEVEAERRERRPGRAPRRRARSPRSGLRRRRRGRRPRSPRRRPRTGVVVVAELVVEERRVDPCGVAGHRADGGIVTGHGWLRRSRIRGRGRAGPARCARTR